MSGQYPPNSTHPFSRGSSHQRGPPSQTVLPPWGQAAGMNMLSGSMNFYGSPHGGRGQPWVPPQPLPVRPGGGNPLWLMTPETSQRIPSEYQQVETMDLSSHSSTPPPALEAPKMMSARSENSDPLRNGAIGEVNGELDRTAGSEADVKDSIMTSVIAMNPLRETLSDALHYSKIPESPVVRRLDSEGPLRNFDPLTSLSVDPVVKCDESDVVGLNTGESFIEDSVSKADYSDTGSERSVLKTGYTNDGTESSVLKVGCSDTGIESAKTDVAEFIRLNDTSDEINRIEDELLNSDPVTKSVEELESSQQSMTSTLNESQSSVLDSSSLSVNTDNSKLVIAESSAEDIFGISPDGSSVIATSQETEKTESSETSLILETEPKKTEAFPSMSSTSNHQWPISKPSSTMTPIRVDSETTPSVENVETLLESMFNSQEETSCSSQNSNSSVPQSVIVSSAGKPVEAQRPLIDLNTPMKEEELAMTLAEDTPVEIKEVTKKEEKTSDDFMDEIEKKLEMLTDSSPCQVPTQSDALETEAPLCESVKQESCSIKDVVSGDDIVVLPKEENVTEVVEDVTKVKTSVPPANTVGPGPNSEPGSSNPFIEVESELEKMFAGIVESTDDTVSEPTSRPSVSAETKKPIFNKKPIPKRKKSNSRRPSDNSVFGGSSNESSPVKKRGRKRKNDSGSEKVTKKLKFDNGENLRKGKLVKDSSNDSFGSKVKGPFVHIEGSKESPASVVVVNSGARADDDDGTDKVSARRKHSSMKRSEARRPGPAYSSSTLSMRYNSDTADLSWVCVFCKRGPHCAGGLGGEAAGDLYGPYRVPATPPIEDVLPAGTPSDRDVVEEQKKLGGRLPKSIRAAGTAPHFVQKMAKKSKRSLSGEGPGLGAGLLQVEGGCEVWLHSQCAEWAPGLCVISTTLVGLEDAVWTALRTKCAHCGDSGAGIGCVVRSCPARVHYPCARATGWLLDSDTFIARCHLHRTRLRPS